VHFADVTRKGGFESFVLKVTWKQPSIRGALSFECAGGSSKEVRVIKKILILSLAAGSLMAIGMAGSAFATDVGGTGGAGTGHEHPIGGSPLRASMVPAFNVCNLVSSNAAHDPTLPGRSCSPPSPRSTIAAVGPSSLAFTRIIVLGTGTCAPFDPTKCFPDVTIRVSATDVRAGSPTGPTFSGSMTGTATIPNASGASTVGNAIQITDAKNQRDTPSGACTAAPNCSGTVVPLPFPIPVTCSAGTCNAQTTANTVAPGSVTAGRRGVIETGQLQLQDSGGNVFENQGIFIP
jgi:hypothetical protein